MSMAQMKGDKGEVFTVSPQEKGRKNKRKLADPSHPDAASLTEFPPYELPSLKSLNSVGKVSDQLQVEDSESVEWDDPFACQLEELLSSNLLTLFLNAMKQLIDCGYTDDDVLKAISGSRLYCGGNNLVSNIVNNALSVLKNGDEGAGSGDYVFEDLQQLVSYTLIEMISLVKEVRPSLSTVEAMWRLLMCDLNVLQAFEVETDGLVTSSKSSDSESLGAECNPPKSSEPDNPKPSQSNAQGNRSEPLKFGNFPNIPNSKKTLCSGSAPGKEAFSCSTGSCEGMKSTSFTLVSDEKLVSCRKGRTKKEIAMLRQKSCVEKIRTYSKCKAAKFASVGSFLLEKRVKSSSDFVARNSSSKMTTEIGVKVSLTDDGSCFVRKSSKLDSPVVMVDAKGFITALPATSVKSASKKKSGSGAATLIPSASEKKPESLVPSSSEKKSGSSVPSASEKKPGSSVPLASEKKTGSESEEKESVSAKLAPDYYAGIPYDASLGIYVPRDKKDELVLKLVPRLNDLQNELQVWTDWANQKVKEATGRLLKDQPELKALRKERQEAEQYKKEKQLLEENTRKRLSEMDFALKNATSQLEKAHNTARRLELEQSLLKKEMEAAKTKAVESAESCREAKERGQKSLKDTNSWEGQKIMLQEELKSQRDKVTVLQKEVTKAKNRQNQIEATLKRERTAKGKLSALASLIKKETKELEALGKMEEERMKAKAETDLKYHVENIKRLEREISELKLKSEYSRIVALKKGSSESKAAGAKRENIGMTKVKRERECVMCLSEEMSVIFLPCAHQVLCLKCNQLHEKEGMMDCPSCRGTIQRRIQARFARAG
ncbi:PREDICTED: putative E3 ubiquitin-protein ligase RF4 [Camelina sativa]|uniref:E3 ubiquitin-protein ligase RF4 n=1 Tax=Camelina sativa TaxID=90675 RepID=A0ABM0X7P2_CAMSA|nr:PREDICTED: putative E3 ubiquitin-protein ligase RF4 [Camelina sativa]